MARGARLGKPLPALPVERALEIVAANGDAQTAALLRSTMEDGRRLVMRNEAIVMAMALHPEKSRTAAAKWLASALRHYLGNGWPRERDLMALAPEASEERKLLHKIARLNRGERGLELRQILNILAKQNVI